MYHSGYNMEIADSKRAHVILRGDDQPSGLRAHPPDNSLRTKAELESTCDLSDQVYHAWSWILSFIDRDNIIVV